MCTFIGFIPIKCVHIISFYIIAKGVSIYYVCLFGAVDCDTNQQPVKRATKLYISIQAVSLLLKL